MPINVVVCVRKRKNFCISEFGEKNDSETEPKTSKMMNRARPSR